jgi:WD repeat-containing protein 23
VQYGEIDVEIEEDGHAERDATETERSEPYYISTCIRILLLILRFAAARQRRQVMRLLANSEIGRLFHFATNDDDLDAIDDDDGDSDYDEELNNSLFRRRRRRTRPDPNRFPKVPSDEGTELMNSGTFGSNEVQMTNSVNVPPLKKLARRILDRELATEDYAHQKVNQRLMAQVRQPYSSSFALS